MECFWLIRIYQEIVKISPQLKSDFYMLPTPVSYPHLDVYKRQGVHYIVMEYVEGVTLKQYIQDHSSISVDMAVRIRCV